ncbi:MgtC/SapB family protein [uncultured Thiohalocapsa sp.]|jgi:putative Mg2+ transporter-C (MgtC) family protein|uniref:MgtC/SapB family protein n=1 Tax=uncultured Thiohalocapsa sp. TaxID=768990 RepID=UPI0025E91851|nr:MgtC/SapB family protein [uncultured Thiohalocapsa sp.]
MDIETEIPVAQMAIRLGAAVLLGLILGLEREVRGKAAGLRTHMLVALGSASFMLAGLEVMYATAAGDPSARIDPTRVIEGVIGGIGFLGAGSIIRGSGSIEGITTGAGIWAAGSIGVACGFGNLILAGMVTGLALVIVVLLGLIERRAVGD